MKKIAFFQLLFIFALASMLGCTKKEDEIDYRLKFLGNYNFQVIKESWVYLDPVNEYDTFYCNGVIREFKLEDIPLDLNEIRDETQNEDVSKKITIVFNPYGIITSLIDEYGVLTPKGSIRYNHNGQFTHPDSISFYVGSLGFGNGNGYNYTIQGVRK
jgi:hypothetical protein